MSSLSRLLLAASGICVAGAAVGQQSTQPFHPIRELTTWYTDRGLVDIEILGSTSALPERHSLEAERVLRFRLERAFVETLVARPEPGYEIATFAFDIETGLPESLLFAFRNRAGSTRAFAAFRLSRGPTWRGAHCG